MRARWAAGVTVLVWGLLVAGVDANIVAVIATLLAVGTATALFMYSWDTGSVQRVSATLLLCFVTCLLWAAADWLALTCSKYSQVSRMHFSAQPYLPVTLLPSCEP